MADSIKAIVFDAYGTLFDVHSVSNLCEDFFPNKGRDISKTWRNKQLEYANLKQIMGSYESFDILTSNALEYAVSYYDEELTSDQKEKLLNCYLNLNVFSDVTDVLDKLEDKQLAIFSNGSHSILAPLIKQSTISDNINRIISADEVKSYKPSMESYAHAQKILQLNKCEILFVSSNGWDISGAKNYGFNTAWINRDNLPLEKLNLEPDRVYSNLNGILEWQ